MDRELKVEKGCWPQLKYAIIFPAFFFAFIFIYNPFSFRTEFSFGGKPWIFHLLMLTCIMVCVIALTRLAFSFLYSKFSLKRWHYLLWCLGEIVLTSCMFALYCSFFSGESYLSVLPMGLEVAGLTLVIPYSLAILILAARGKDAETQNVPKAPGESLLRLFDESGKLKLTIDPSAIVFVKADANYININYMENGALKPFPLRNSMKSFESAAGEHGLLRCQRSYYVNPKYVKTLSKDRTDGIFYVELSVDGADRIPVGMTYYKNLSDVL